MSSSMTRGNASSLTLPGDQVKPRAQTARQWHFGAAALNDELGSLEAPSAKVLAE